MHNKIQGAALTLKEMYYLAILHSAMQPTRDHRKVRCYAYSQCCQLKGSALIPAKGLAPSGLPFVFFLLRSQEKRRTRGSKGTCPLGGYKGGALNLRALCELLVTKDSKIKTHP